MAIATQIILDPNAHHHRTGRAWQGHQREWLRRLAPVEVSVAESAAEAEAATRVSALKGFRKIIAVGGSETAHGAVNGLMQLAETHRKSVGLGFFSIIRPGDWSRTIEFPRALERQLEVLQAGHTMPCDVGRIDCFTEKGRSTTRYFLNGAGFGLGPQLRHEVRAHPNQLLERAGGLLTALRDGVLNRGPLLKLEGESGTLYEGPCPVGLVMGGRYYPALGRVAPQASPTDGTLDIVWYASPSRREMLLRVAGLIARRALPGGAPGRARAASVQVQATNAPVYLEADGQFIGRAPATIAVEPRALSIIVPQVGAKLMKPKFAPLPKAQNGPLTGHLNRAAGQ